MGNPASKLNDHTEDTVLAEVSIPSSPILTPKPKIELDPRSPSTEIARTPIETLSTFYQTSDEELITSVQFQTPNSSIYDSDSFYECPDPRSPNCELTRTPIIHKTVKQSDIRKKLLKTSYKHCSKIEGEFDGVENTLTKSPPKLLESSPVSTSVSEKRLSSIGLLETNLDYVETDIDTIVKNKKLQTKVGNKEKPTDIKRANFLKQFDTPTKSLGNIEDIIDPRSPTIGINRTPLQIVSQVDIDPRSPTVDFNTKTPLPAKLDNAESVPDIQEREKNVKSAPCKQSLIYEDSLEENICVTPIVNPNGCKQEVSTRTPLSVRNSNGPHSRSKSANGRLHKAHNENQVNLKTHFPVSKIPVFNKNTKKLRSKNLQCENTPPLFQNHDKRAQWDVADSTMII